ncbi:MAG TPA: LLM class flavin-dependent oxidoreductase [Candidatus Limnocylindria bacterium]|nr:LLM class flavin-dependent oxidoreductase [Candidatus Limnocylindria bacterium]
MATVERLPERPGLIGFRLAATGGAGLDWRRLDETWALAGELDVFDAGWMSDHLSDASRERGGPAFEAFTTAAALARRVPGKWVGIAVVANTFRHPAVTAKAATVLDNVTGGRFILGMGAGWHVGEHESYGISLPPLRERFDRFESALRVLQALFSPAAAEPDGVTLDDPIFPLRHAANLPPPVRPGGPLIWLGGQKRRGMALAARYASGWPLPGNRPGDVAYFSEKRSALRKALEAAGRDPDAFAFAAQVACGTTPDELRAARVTAQALVRAGATHIILGIAAASAPDALRPVATEVAEPLLS